MPSPARGSTRAFTLIELLVVIAIIAVLIGLLLPAVQKVREAASKAKCQNNLKQLALASHMYLDANQKLPPAAAHSEHGTWFILVLPYMEQQAMFDKYLYAFAATGKNFWGNTLTQSGTGSIRYNDIYGTVANANKSVTTTKYGGTHVPTLLCPSDPVNRNTYTTDLYTLHNYLACYGGNSYSSRYYAPSSEPFLGAAFECKSQYRQSGQVIPNANTVSAGVTPANISDGMSNTLLFSETITNFGGNSSTGSAHGLVWQSEMSGFVTSMAPNDTAADQILLGGWCGTLTTTSRPVPCKQADTTANLPRLAARSLHLGGVNAALGDGSVRFFSDRIGVTNGGVNVWVNLGTARGGEAATAD